MIISMILSMIAVQGKNKDVITNLPKSHDFITHQKP